MNVFQTLFYKEMLRFWKVATQTVFAPILTAILYLMIFGHVLQNPVQVYPGVQYVSFLIPGLVMMSAMQNACANSSSSMIQSKITGKLVFVLLKTLSHWEMYGGYVLAAMVRGLIVGPVVLFGAVILGNMGLVAGIWAEKFDSLAAFQNFLIVPLTFLAGVFYSIHSLLPTWQMVSHFNPCFYMIDGFRYGFSPDINPLYSLGIVLAFLLVLSTMAVRLLKSGYKLRS